MIYTMGIPWLHPILLGRIEPAWGFRKVNHDILHLRIVFQDYLMGFTSNAGLLVAAKG